MNYNMGKYIITIGIVLAIVAAIVWSVFAFPNQKTIQKSVSITELENKSELVEQQTQQTVSDDMQEQETVAVPEKEKEIVQPQQEELKKEEPKVAEQQKKANTAKVQSNGDFKIVDRLISWGFQKASNRTIKAVIVHSSYNAIGGDVYDFEKVIETYKQYGVGAHYFIDRDGTVYRLVSDENVAYHAGVSKLPDGTTDVNSVSLGIEMMNTKDDKFTDAQYSSLNKLIASAESKYSIKYILGHDEIAPDRKTDPWNIDWNKVNR